MQSVLNFIWNLVVAHQNEIYAAAGYIICNLLVYLTKYPTGRGPGTVALHLIDAIACVQHSDVPPKSSCIDWPGFLSRLNFPGWLSNHPDDAKPVAKVDESAKTPPKADTVIAPLLCIFLASSVLGCAGTNPYQDAYRVVTGARYAATVTAQGLTQYDAMHQQALANDARAQCKARQPVADVSAPVDSAALIACQQTLGKQLLMDWDAKHKKIQLARDGVRTALDVAEMAVSVAEKAKSGAVTLHTVTDPLGKVIKDLATVLTEAGVPPIYAAALTALGGI
jgi:hypothetical protein